MHPTRLIALLLLLPFWVVGVVHAKPAVGPPHNGKAPWGLNAESLTNPDVDFQLGVQNARAKIMAATELLGSALFQRKAAFLSKVANLGEDIRELGVVIDNLDNLALSRFLDDFEEASKDLLRVLAERPGLVSSWDFIRRAIPLQSGTTKFALDPKTLEKVADLSDPNSLFRQSFPDDWNSRLTELLENNNDLRCGACGNMDTKNSRLARLPSIDEMLDHANYISQFSKIDGFSSVWNALGSGPDQRDGVNFMIRFMKKNEADFANVRAFEFRYEDDILRLADVATGVGKDLVKWEFKSWSPDNYLVWKKFFKGEGTSYEQFLDYLKYSNGLASQRYVFNFNKADELTVKNAFKDLFTTKKGQIFEILWDNPALRDELFPDLPINITPQIKQQYFINQFQKLIDSTDSKLYTFLISQ